VPCENQLQAPQLPHACRFGPGFSQSSDWAHA
jgi:hypothetical protein